MDRANNDTAKPDALPLLRQAWELLPDAETATALVNFLKWDGDAEADDGQPKTDLHAIELLVKLVPGRFVAVNGSGAEHSIWTYDADSGLWSDKKAPFRKLCAAHKDSLGKYGTMKARMDTLFGMAGMYNQVQPEWTQRLSALL